MVDFDINLVMQTLSQTRPVFNSEADFQHAFAWEIKQRYPQSELRLEYVVPRLGYHLDVLVYLERHLIPIELKYKTVQSDFVVGGEAFALKNHLAQDIGCYDIVKDIMRIEHIVDELHCAEGFTISLTNDPSYWIFSNRSTIADDFRLTDGRVLSGDLGWAEYAGTGSTKSREQRLLLRQEYPLIWQDYSSPGAGRSGAFRYLMTVCKG